MSEVLELRSPRPSLQNMASILVLGGCGFIGRHLVTYLVENNLASSIRVVDKVLIQTAYLSPKHKLIFASPLIEYIQANLCSNGKKLNLSNR